MRRLIVLTCGLLFAARLPAAQDPPSRFPLPTRHGRAVLEWVSNSSFRFCRGWDENSCASRGAKETEETRVEKIDTERRLEFRTPYLHVTLQKESLRLRVTTAAGLPLLEETRETARTADGVVIEQTAAIERLYGLGARSDPAIDVRGRTVTTETPFLMSSRGYGLYYVTPGKYVFDLARTWRESYQVAIRGAAWIDYYFYYGPSPKQILEEHRRVTGSPRMLSGWQCGLLQQTQLPPGAAPLPPMKSASEESLRRQIRSLVNGSLSGIVFPAFDLTPCLSWPLALYRRALQAGSLVPILFLSNSILLEPERQDLLEETAGWRKRLAPFLLSYAAEAHTLGIPVIHPLPLQFSGDPESAGVDDEFMLGDEILAAPLFTVENRRSVYFPRGIWTELRTNRTYKGKQRVEVESEGGETPIFVRNGSIVPLGPLKERQPMILHYFPNLGAEFFLYEPAVADYTQFHAGPAGDAVRLEIESKADRLYEWVVRRMPRPKKVVIGGVSCPEAASPGPMSAGRWRYDPAGNIHVRLRTSRPQSHVVYITF